MIVIKGLSQNIKINNKKSLHKQILDIMPYWFQEIDKIYFNHKHDEIKINLDDIDKQIISLSSDCLDKLKTLTFKKNITILNFNS